MRLLLTNTDATKIRDSKARMYGYTVGDNKERILSQMITNIRRVNWSPTPSRSIQEAIKPTWECKTHANEREDTGIHIRGQMGAREDALYRWRVV